jgi:hypothetical protein
MDKPVMAAKGFLQELFARFGLRPGCGIERRDEGRRMR